MRSAGGRVYERRGTCGELGPSLPPRFRPRPGREPSGLRSASARRIWNRLRGRAYRFGARSGAVGRFAFALRRAATLQVRYRLVASLDGAENGETWLLATFGPELQTVFDVGANVGDWSFEVLRCCPNLTFLGTYEPSVDTCAILKSRFGSQTGVEIVQAAMSDAPGIMTFYDQAPGAQTSSLLAQWTPGAPRREVPVTTVDDEMKRVGLRTLSLLKIDTEGYDLHVLRGARQALERHAIGMVQFEYNRPWMFAGSTLQAASAFLEECGYDLFLLNATGLCRCDVRTLGELFEYLNFVAMPKDRTLRSDVRIQPDPLWGS